jgi:DNA-binding CsgD family transcriptional regulator
MTVETHHANLFLKANIRKIAGLIAWAIRNQYYSVE